MSVFGYMVGETENRRIIPRRNALTLQENRISDDVEES